MKLRPLLVTSICVVLASGGSSWCADDAALARPEHEIAGRIDSLRAELRAIDQEIDVARKIGSLGDDLVTTRRNIVHDIEDAEAEMENLRFECPCEPDFRD